MCINVGQEYLTLVLTQLRSHQRTNIGFSDILIFIIKLEHRVSNITQLTCTKLPQVLPMDKIEVKFTNFHRKTTIMFEIGLFCDSYLLKKFLLLITIIPRNALEHKVLLSKIVLNPIFIVS